MIQICGEFVTNTIAAEIKQAKYFSILADEATDWVNIEQMSIVIRFVDSNSSSREEFLGIVPCELGVSGKAIAEIILKELRNFDLSISLSRGQG